MTIGNSTAAEQLVDLVPLVERAPKISVAEREQRLLAAQEILRRKGAAALLVNAGPSLRYFSGVSWGPSERLVALLLPADGKPMIICPAFELGSLVAELAIEAELLLWEEDEDPIGLVDKVLVPGAALAIDPLLPFSVAARLGRNFDLVDGSPAIDGMRMVKSVAELALMAEAKAMTLEVHRRAARMLAPGIRASAVKRFIDQAHRAMGTAGSTFCAVQFGQATAYPHGLPEDQVLAENQLVLIDTGCTVDGYHSDITRTYAFGNVDNEIRAMWDLEKEAQAAAFDAVEPDKPCEAVDAAARAVLERAGLGPGYRLPGLPHRTGHGIGLAIHEPAYLVRGDHTALKPGMCFSNEPMIVVPDRFGIRLEDHFHVTETGAAWFTEPQHSIDRPFG